MYTSTIYIYICISAGPCLPGATRLRRMVNHLLISYPNCFSIFHHQFINPCKFSLTNQQLIHQLVINLLFAGLQVQVSHLVIGGSSAPGPSLYHPPGPCSQFWVVLEINQISMHIQYTRKSLKWCPKTSKCLKNEVQTGT